MHIHQSDMPEVCLADVRYKAPAQWKLFFFFMRWDSKWWKHICYYCCPSLAWGEGIWLTVKVDDWACGIWLLSPQHLGQICILWQQGSGIENELASWTGTEGGPQDFWSADKTVGLKMKLKSVYTLSSFKTHHGSVLFFVFLMKEFTQSSSFV